ncbi:MAG: hypothetical protein MUD15_07740 [Desulfobacterota bacterium]|nr:hypothetical protein [Thermodesulfobacteriota bacterium]
MTAGTLRFRTTGPPDERGAPGGDGTGQVLVIVLCCLVQLLVPLRLSGGCLFCDATYRGKVIDAETLKPLEGVVVVAEWRECWPGVGAGELCDFKMVKEALTDRDGEWSITGPAGEEPTEFGYLRAALSFVVHWTERPSIQTYKRGYRRNDKGPGRFEAFPFIRKDQGQEGIILIRPGDTREEERLFTEKYGGLFWPFIPMKDPEKNLRELNFDFKYPQKIQDIEAEGRTLRPNYIVYGLSRAQTAEDFRNAPGLLLHTKATGRLKILPRIIERDSKEDFKGYD